MGMSKNGITKSFLAHRLVGFSFVKNPYEKPDINHLDGIKINNYRTNLEWVTKAENIKHAIDTGLRNLNGENNHASKLNIQKVNEMIKIRKETGLSYNKIAAQYGISVNTCRDAIIGKSWAAYKEAQR